MKIAQLNLPEKIEIRNVPVRREAEPKEVLLEPIKVGIGGTDLLRYRKGSPAIDGFRRPHIPCSEFVARVVEVGRGVDISLRGMRVVANPVSPCLKCDWCLEGDQNLCPNVRILGLPPVQGVLQQRFSWPASLCVPVPDSIPDHLAVLLVPLSLSIHTVDLAQMRMMDSVAVVGCGHHGLLTIKTLRAAGAGKILAVDLIDYRRRAALEHGADQALTVDEAHDIVRGWRRGGVDIAIDTSNASEGCRTAVSLTQLGGRVLIAGIPSDNRIIFNAQEARRRELLLQFVRRPHDTLWRAVNLMKSGMLRDLDKIVTHQFDLENIDQAFNIIRHLKEEVIKVLIDMPPYSPAEEGQPRRSEG